MIIFLKNHNAWTVKKQTVKTAILATGTLTLLSLDGSYSTEFTYKCWVFISKEENESLNT